MWNAFSLQVSLINKRRHELNLYLMMKVLWTILKTHKFIVSDIYVFVESTLWEIEFNKVRDNRIQITHQYITHLRTHAIRYLKQREVCIVTSCYLIHSVDSFLITQIYHISVVSQLKGNKQSPLLYFTASAKSYSFHLTDIFQDISIYCIFET